MATCSPSRSTSADHRGNNAVKRRLALAARSLTIGAVFLGAAAVFHLFATPHIAAILRKVVDAKVYGFLEPILSFVFVLNAILLLPLSLITFISAAGVRRGERWAWRIAIIITLTILALPCTILATMGVQYFAGAPLFLAGTLSVTAAGLFMLVALLLARPDLARNG
jgi:hypothetical protein